PAQAQPHQVQQLSIEQLVQHDLGLGAVAGALGGARGGGIAAGLAGHEDEDGPRRQGAGRTLHQKVLSTKRRASGTTLARSSVRQATWNETCSPRLSARPRPVRVGPNEVVRSEPTSTNADPALMRYSTVPRMERVPWRSSLKP